MKIEKELGMMRFARRTRLPAVTLVALGVALFGAVGALVLAMQSAEAEAVADTAGRRELGLRDLALKVNLRDFLDMVLNELRLVGSSSRDALEMSGPGVLPLVLVPALLRLVLLLLVVAVLGAAILALTLLRVAARAVHG